MITRVEASTGSTIDRRAYLALPVCTSADGEAFRVALQCSCVLTGKHNYQRKCEYGMLHHHLCITKIKQEKIVINVWSSGAAVMPSITCDAILRRQQVAQPRCYVMKDLSVVV